MTRSHASVDQRTKGWEEEGSRPTEILVHVHGCTKWVTAQHMFISLWNRLPRCPIVGLRGRALWFVTA